MKLRTLFATSLTLIGLTPVAALAVDGVILIDQNKALAGNVTPGDTAGYPVIISQPGSYRLSGNLTVPDGALAAVQITANDVTLDLNGFTIRGSGIFPTALLGISGDNRKRVRVANGTISGFVQPIVFGGTAQATVIESLQVDAATTTTNGTTVGGVAMQIGETLKAGAIIRNVNANGQIQVTCPSVVTNVAVQGGGGIVEMVVPPNGSGVSFPTNCKGDNVVTFF